MVYIYICTYIDENRFIIQCKHDAEEEHLLGYLHWWCYVSMYFGCWFLPLDECCFWWWWWWWHRNGVVVNRRVQMQVFGVWCIVVYTELRHTIILFNRYRILFTQFLHFRLLEYDIKVKVWIFDFCFAFDLFIIYVPFFSSAYVCVCVCITIFLLYWLVYANLQWRRLHAHVQCFFTC